MSYSFDAVSYTNTGKRLKKYQCGDVSVTKNADGSITFSANGGQSSVTLSPDEVRGLGIKKVEINSNNHLICTLDDDTTIDAGVLPSCSNENYTEEITTPSSTWTVQHNLGAPYWKLTINIIDADGNTTEGDIDINSSTNNLLVIKFNEPISGKIYIKK